MPTSRNTAKLWLKTILTGLALATLISTTGCSRRYVTVDGAETMPVKKGELDQLYKDNEALVKALVDCRSAR